jgi:Arc/MetJ-type ribon-helix-helix transcriptional regulator
MPELNKETLTAELARRYGIRMDEDDPAFAMVALNCLALENAVKQLSEAIREGISELEDSMQRVDRRAGTVIAQEVTETAARVRAELQKDIDSAGLKAAHLVYQVDQAHKRPALIRWLAVGLVSAGALFASGLWIGARYLQ